MKVEVDVLGFPSLIAFMVSMDLKLELGIIMWGTTPELPVTTKLFCALR